MQMLEGGGREAERSCDGQCSAGPSSCTAADGWMDDACLASLKGKKEDSIGITTDCHWDIPAGAIGDEAKQ